MTVRMTRSSRSSVVSRREELRAKAGDAGVVDAGLQLRVRVGCFATLVPASRLARGQRAVRAVLVGGDDNGAVDAIVEPHD